MSIIIPANTLATGGFEVANSARFNNPSSDYLNKSFGNGNRKTFTISAWVKRSNIAGVDPIFSRYTADSDAGFLGLYINSNAKLNFTGWNTVYITTNRLFRDLSAWYHIVLAVDTTQSTNTNRWKLYINGVQETSFATAAYPNQNTDLAINQNVAHMVGRYSGNYLAGYMSEVVFIDGLALAPDQFGEFDEDSGIWKPIDVSGLTFGTNGFYLNFQTSAELGDDVSGNTNDFTENNLIAVDQTTDTCTNNFATWNGVIRASDLTLSEGNTQAAGGNASYHGTYASIVPTSGKWYAEFKITAPTYGQIGIITADTLTDGNRTVYSLSSNIYWQDNVTTIKYFLADGDGTATSQGNAAVSGGSNSVATYTTNDIISIAIDVDNGKGYFAKNGTFVNSSNPANGTNSFTLASDYARGSTWYFGGNNYTVQANFGNPPYAISSGNADGDGFGNFEYAVPSGYFALCSKNLAEYG